MQSTHERAKADAMSAREYATVAELIALYRKRAASPVEVAKHLLERISKYESSLHCFVTLTPEVALQRARDAEQKLKHGNGADTLCGVPYGLKDVISTGGILTTGQSK